MMHWGDHGMGYGYGWVFTILIWIGIIVAIVYLVKMLGKCQEPSEGSNESAEEILRKRYAKGELTREEFEEAQGVLRRAIGNPGGGPKEER